MDSETRCTNSYKIKERCDLIIPHYCHSGDLPIEIIISDLKYIKSQINVGDIKYDRIIKNINAFKNNLEEIIIKLTEDKYNCRFHNLDCGIIDELIYMLLPILDHIVNKISSDVFFVNLKYDLESHLNIEIHYPFVKDPVNNSS